MGHIFRAETAAMSGTREPVGRFMRRDAWTEGRQFLEEAVRREPDDAEARAHLGFFCVKESRYDVRRGLAEFDAALRRDPRCWIARIYRAVVRAYLKEYDAAMKEVREAEAAGAPAESAAWAEGCVELEAGSAEKAGVHFRRLVAMRPESGNMLMLAKACSQAGDNEQALAWAKKASGTDPDDFRAPVYMGIYLAYLRRFAESRAALTKAETMKKDYALLHHTWAYVAREEGKGTEVEERLRTVLDIDPDYVTSRKMLADLCAGSGRVEEARRHYLSALELFPDYAEARDGLRRLEPLR